MNLFYFYFTISLISLKFNRSMKYKNLKNLIIKCKGKKLKIVKNIAHLKLVTKNLYLKLIRQIFCVNLYLLNQPRIKIHVNVNICTQNSIKSQLLSNSILFNFFLG